MNPRYITPSLVRDYVDRMAKMKDLNERPYDPNISKADLAANIFVLVVLVASVVWLIIGG